MLLRDLLIEEQKNWQTLISYVGDVALLMPTSTGLRKSILDATIPVRSLLKEAGLHDYAKQGQGDSAKVLIPAIFFSADGLKETRATLYRPQTKKGDPRIWFRGLPYHAGPNDIVGLFEWEGKLCVLNLTSTDLNAQDEATKQLIAILLEISKSRNAIAVELLGLLRTLATKGPLISAFEGDKAVDAAVGRAVETALGIPQNCSRDPDYKGIELKSYRTRRQENRANLFSKTPDWANSKLKSGRELLDAFGYVVEGRLQLYVTVRATTMNAQGLRLRLEVEDAKLIEFHEPSKVDYMQWELVLLHQQLLTKHKETFWIKAKAEIVDGKEYFTLLSVRHTERPSVVQFDTLLSTGVITLDHTLSAVPGGANDHGYLFKLTKPAIPILFPNPKDYSLAP